MAKRKPWPDAADDPSRAIMRGFRDFAARASGPTVPIPHLEDDFTRRTTERDDFEIVKFEQVGGAQVVHLRWTKQGPEGELHEALLYLIAWAGHQGMFVEKSMGEGSIQYDVVATTRTSRGEHLTHALRFLVRGEGVDALLARWR